VGWNASSHSTIPHTAPHRWLDVRFLPVFLDLLGRHALVLGVGEVAERKADALHRAGAIVRIEPVFRPEMLDGCVVAIGADAAEPELMALSAAAQARGIPVNVVDNPPLCSFITPSVIDRDPLVVAVSTGGAAPVLARMVRARIEGLLPPAWGRLAQLADSLKSHGLPGRGAAAAHAGAGARRTGRGFGFRGGGPIGAARIPFGDCRSADPGRHRLSGRCRAGTP